MVLGSQARLNLRRVDRNLKIVKLSQAYLKQAEARITDAKEAYERENYPYTVRLSQECVELSVKASLRAVGIEYPKEHEVSHLLSELQARFPPWFILEVSFIQETSKSLYKKRELAFYGGEDAFLSPEDVISQGDAEKAAKSAEHVFRVCKKLIDELVFSLNS